MSGDGIQQEATAARSGLRPHEDARAIVRLFQCSQCSYPIREPVTLPCGQSICRPCMPSSHLRTNITYPQNADRAQGFNCPFKDCGMQHSLADCSLDVSLSKTIEVVQMHMALQARNAAGPSLQLDERLHWRNVVDSNIDIMPRSRVSTGGHIVSAFGMAGAGELNYHSELAFMLLESWSKQDIRKQDAEVVDGLGDIIRAELECHVCYCLMVDPLTTPCGHTFCRKCVARVLDHSTLCPACRRPLLSMRPGVSTEASNKRISHIIDGLLADELAARIIGIQEEETVQEDGWLSLFPCTLAYPGMPTFIHVFEPRYRLMIRRCIENGSRKFGMVMYNGHRLPQGVLGRSQYMQYGTVLHISRLEVLPDGRSLLETHGVSRFRVLEGSLLDGYHIGRVQRIDDMPLAEEEAIEAQETSGPEPDEADFEAKIRHMSTLALLRYGLDFIQQARHRSADWLHERVLAAYGQPPTDPATFPFWFASVLPINDDEKYALLPTTSVRERLKMTARWVRVLEEARCASLRFLRLARPLEPRLPSNEATQSEEAQPVAATGAQAVPPETTELYDADDPRSDTAENDPSIPS